MKIHVPSILCAALLLSCVVVQQAWALSSGIIGYSGNPDTNSGNVCINCHTGGTAPQVELIGPLSMEAGSTAEFTLGMTGGQENTGGFNISATTGSLSAISANTSVQNGELKHTQAISVGTSGIVWSFSYTAPVSTGIVTLHAAALSADNDNTLNGDYSTTVSLDIEITPAQKLLPPNADAGGPYSGTPGVDVSFDASGSMDGDGEIVRYLWDFGDGSDIAQGVSVVHAYATEGDYTVTLAATDNDKLTGAVAVPVKVISSADIAQGQSLYNQYCFACHGTGGAGGIAVSVIGVTASQITSAISTFPEMGSIVLTAQEIQLIAVFLISGGGEPPPRPTDGSGLYSMFCAACHGSDGRGGTYIGVTAAPFSMIADAIDNIVPMQNIALSLEEMQLVAEYLLAGGGGDIPLTGAELYQVFCSVCHGSGGHGAKFQAVTGAPAAMIGNAINKQALMNQLALTTTQLNEIGAFLVAGGSGPLPTDGAGLYGVFCGVCHGADGRGGSYKVVTGSSLSFINNALNNVNLMQPLQLNSADRLLIADYLAAGGAGIKPVSGSGLYHVFCETCHGPNGSGGPEEQIIGVSQSSINNAISGETNMQQLLPYLSTMGPSSDTALIRDFLQ